MDQITQLSSTIVHYSLDIREGDRVLITTYTDQPLPLIKELIKKITEVGGIPFVRIVEPSVHALLSELTTDKRIIEQAKHKMQDVENYDCFINIRYTTNDFENGKIPTDVLKKLGEATKESDFIRVNQRRWVLLNYPSRMDAYKAHMKTDDFYDYSMKVMTINYADMDERIKPLKELMEHTDQVRIIAPGTDLTFSIKGLPAIPCCGTMNIPDGEIYTAPVKDSVNGVITYNTPSPYQGRVYNHVKLIFENGKIINAECDEDNEALNKIFDTDEGARSVGEFSFGLNPEILHPMGDILFDEKIIGSIHFTPGQAYDNAYNGNDSSIHWDMVLIQRKEYGGGEIYFDHKLIRKDGLFVLPELQHLNYHLK